MAAAKKKAAGATKPRRRPTAKTATKAPAKRKTKPTTRRRSPRPPASPPATVEESVRRDLDAIRARDPALADSALALAAVALAREIDSGRNSATSKSMCSRELRETMLKLRELAPEPAKGDRIDELSRRRAARRARGARAASQ